ncbi:MAG: MATE family efflux transporter [Candidatus Poribacteria bacterium]|nr:MATE family efflux transporter [Candidatus Poribacteria bacterium]
MQEYGESPGKKNGQTVPGGYREVWLLAYPVVITMASRTAMMLVDTAMVGRLGLTELAAVGLAGILTWTLFSFFNGLLVSINTFVAQRYGADDRRGIAVATWQGLYIALGSYLVVLLISRFMAPLFALMKPSAEIQRLGGIYAQIRLYGGISLFISVGIGSFLRGVGDTKTPMRIELVVNVINIILDYLLIFGNFGFPRLEVAGAAIATLIAGIIAAVGYLAVFLSRKSDQAFQTRSQFQMDVREIRRILRIGIPLGVQFFLDLGSFTVFAALIGRMGDVALAANNAAIALVSASFMPLQGFSLTATTLVGQYIGSDQLHYARKSGYTTIKMGVVYTFVVAVLFLTMPAFLLSLITPDPEVVQLGKRVLFFAAIFQLSDGFGICSAGALKGAGDTLFTMWVSIGYAWLLFLPLAYGLGTVLGYGIAGAWCGATIYIVLVGTTYFLRFRSDRWERIQI